MSEKQFQLSADRVENKFKDYKAALNAVEAVTEASRCINCYDAPCINACPTGINIPQFISRIGNENTLGAARTILDSNIFGLSCAQSCPTEVLCEGACVYNALNKKPIMIGRLQRFAVETAYDQNIKFYEPGNSNGKKVALVGAGPASLSCAHELRKHGYETEVFEKSEIPGGLNTTGIAPYKMKADTSLREIKQILEMGIKINYNQELGKNIQLETLTKDYNAVFLGMGLGPDSRLEIQPPSHSLVHGAVEYIAKLKTLPVSQMSELKNIKTALVIGGGNTALDACRELKQLGIEKVLVSYRRTAADMSGYKHELNSARTEGVEFLFNTSATKFETASKSVKVTLSDSRVVEAELVLLAIGQAKLKFENIKNPKIFMGGDFLNGGKEVVNAVAEGKKAALEIHQFLSSGRNQS